MSYTDGAVIRGKSIRFCNEILADDILIVIDTTCETLVLPNYIYEALLSLTFIKEFEIRTRYKISKGIMIDNTTITSYETHLPWFVFSNSTLFDNTNTLILELNKLVCICMIFLHRFIFLYFFLLS